MHSAGVHFHRELLHYVGVCPGCGRAIRPYQIRLEKHVGARADTRSDNRRFHPFRKLARVAHHWRRPRHRARHVRVLVKLGVVNDVLGGNAHAVFFAALHEGRGRKSSPLARGGLDEVIRNGNGCRSAVVVFDAKAHGVARRRAFAGEVVIAPLGVDVLDLEAEWLVSGISDEADEVLAIARSGFQSKLAAFVVAKASRHRAVFTQLPFAEFALDELVCENIRLADLHRGLAFHFADEFFSSGLFAGRPRDEVKHLRAAFLRSAQRRLFQRCVNHAILLLLDHHADGVAVRPDDVRAEVLEVAEDVWVFPREVAAVCAKLEMISVNFRVNTDAVDLPIWTEFLQLSNQLRVVIPRRRCRGGAGCG